MTISEQQVAPAVHSEVRCGDADRLFAGELGLVVSVAVSCSAIQERAFFSVSLVLLSFRRFLIFICISIFAPVLPCTLASLLGNPVSSLHDVIHLSETERKEMGKKIWNAYRYGARQGFFFALPV